MASSPVVCGTGRPCEQCLRQNSNGVLAEKSREKCARRRTALFLQARLLFFILPSPQQPAYIMTSSTILHFNRCPTGDNTYTDGVTDIQRVTCTGGAGVFTLTFRDETTAELDFSISVEDLEAALEATPWCVRPLVQPVRPSFGVDGNANVNNQRPCA